MTSSPRLLRGLLSASIASAALDCAPLVASPPENSDSAATEAQYIDRLRSRLPADETLFYERGGPSLVDGFTFARYLHTKAGLHVEGGGVFMRMRDGRIVSVRTELARLSTFSTTPVTTLSYAVLLARRAVSRELRSVPHQFAPGSPSCTLIIAQVPITGRSTSQHQLQYRCTVELSTPVRKFLVAVDGASPAVLWMLPLERTLPAIGSATVSLENLGALTFPAEALVSSCTLSSARVHTLDMQNTFTSGQTALAQEYPGTLSNGLCTFGPGTEEGTLSHWAGTSAVASFDRAVGATVIDSFPGGKIFLYLDTAGAPPNQTANSNTGTTFVFMATPTVATIGHEMGHEFLDATGFTHYVGESGVMHESWAEIWSVYTKAIAGDFSKLSSILAAMPDVYGGAGWLPTNSPINYYLDSTVMSLAFLRASYGGTGTNSANDSYDVEGIGGSTALLFYNTAMAEQLTAADSLADLSTFAEQVAVDTCGSHAAAARSIHNGWYSVGVEPIEDALPYMNPTRGASAVPSWPARVSWQNSGDGPWVVELRQTSTPAVDGFTPLWDPLNPAIEPAPAQVTSILAQGTDTENGHSVGFAELNLPPNTTWEWRVRSQSAPAMINCWRARGWFTTFDPIPIPLTPNLPQAHHPWRLEFTMALAEGTNQVEIEVSRDAGMHNLVFPTKRFDVDPAGADRTAGVALNVPKGSDLYWRVRARASGSGASSWSQAVPFVTRRPIVTLHSPTNGATEYPWGLELKWNELLGAARYDVDFTATPPDSIDRDGAVPGDETSLIRSFSAADNAPNSYAWNVIALGPPLGSAQDPEPATTAEPSERSATWSFAVDKAATLVQLVSPIYNPMVKGCQRNTLLVQWVDVPEAIEYRITIFKVYTNFGLPPVDFVGNTVVYTSVIPAPRISSWIESAAVLSPDQNDISVAGYHVLVQAVGPDQAGGAPGDKNSNMGRYYLMPSIPFPLNPAAATMPWSEHYLHMLWAVGFTPAGLIELETHYYPDCTGSANVSTVQANHYGATAVETGPRDAGSISSWRARPAYAEHCSFASIAWSPCTNYLIPSGPVSHGTCNTPFDAETGDVAGRMVEVHLPSVNTHAAIVFNTLNIPDRIVVTAGDAVLVDKGCVSTKDGCPPGCAGYGGTCWCPFDSGVNNDTVTVVVTTNCGAPNQDETLWSFQVACLGDAGSIALAPGAE